jgi:aminopeptidase N
VNLCLEDFRRAIEKHSSMNLTEFFDQWFYSNGYPQLKGNYSWDAEKKEAKFSVDQTQVNKDKEISLFKFQLEIELVDENKKSYLKTLQFEVLVLIIYL